MKRFEAFVAYYKLSWPRLASGKLCTDDETFREMAMLYPIVNPLRELRCSLSKLKLNALAVGADARNRTPLWAYWHKDRALCAFNHEIRLRPCQVAAFQRCATAGACADPSRLSAAGSSHCGGGERRRTCWRHVRVATFIWASPSRSGCCATVWATKSEPPCATLPRSLFCPIQYGAGVYSLAALTGLTRSEAHEILARLRARFHRFYDFVHSVGDHAGLNLEISTCFDWRLKCPSGSNPRTIRNFPMQSTGAMILHTACLLAERRGIEIVAPIHDAFVAQCDARDVEDVSAALDRVMRDASAVVLRGYELPTDCQIIRPGERYFDKRGSGDVGDGDRAVGQAGAGERVMGNPDLSDLWRGLRRAGSLRHGWSTATASEGLCHRALGMAGTSATGSPERRSAPRYAGTLPPMSDAAQQDGEPLQHRAAGAGDQPSDQVPRLSRVGGSRSAH